MVRKVVWFVLLASIGVLVWALALDSSEQGSEQVDAAIPTEQVTTAAKPIPNPTKPAPIPAASAAEAQRELAQLRVIDRRPVGLPSYDRDQFGDSWSDVDHNGCNQRDDVLLRDASKGTVTVARQHSCDRDVLAGTWFDPYTGNTLTFTDLKDPSQAQAIQIDHVVPLSEAWQSGASAWTPERRLDYANDLGNLLAVDGPTNASKGDDDPAAWRPRKAFQCAYAVRWISVKYYWNLAADASEIAALKDMLDYCD